MISGQASSRAHIDGFVIPVFFRDPRRACRGKDTEVFYPDEHSGPATGAKTVCRRCPFVDECREWAIDHREAGVWGATTASERKAIRADRKRDPLMHPEAVAA